MFKPKETSMPTIQGLLETALYVKNVQDAANFYRRIFGFGTLLESERLIALDVVGRNVLLLFREGSTGEPLETAGGIIPAHAGASPTHLAFSVNAAELDDWRQRLASENVVVESTVHWTGGASSLYFRDLDQNLVELITPGFWKTY
jgi:catechol 2,3-dioxygenase-like lactoylglutathione lyase family enzyme